MTQAEKISPSKGYFILLIFDSVLEILGWNHYNIVMYCSDWRDILNLDFNLHLLKIQRHWKYPGVQAHPKVSGFLSKGRAKELLEFSVSGEMFS